MSNLFPGKQPTDEQDDRKEASTTRTPLFPRKEDQPASPFAARPGVTPEPASPRAPLFPKKEDSKAPLFPPRDNGQKSSVFGNREENKPLFPPRDPATPGTAPRAPLFPRKEGSAPMFGTKPAEPAKSLFGTKPAEPTKSLFGAKPAEPAKPMFGTRTETARPAFGAKPAEPAKPLFGARPATPPTKPLFGSNPAAPARPMFSTTPPAPSTGSFSSVGSPREIKVSDEEFIQLRDFLYQQAGIFIAENRKYLVENRLATRLRELGLRNFGEYYNYLRFDSNRAKELNVFYENMTTNETSFFRNGPQLDVFRDKVLLKVIEEARAKGQKKLRIWSAGCSSGEEPYTLAMIIYEVLKQETPQWDIKITANDLSLAVLAAARRGLYNDYAIRTTPQDMLDKYFTKEGNLYRIDPKLAKLISFGQINLNDKVQLSKVERSQIVFCRNVIIYFDDEMKKSVINAFYDNLLPGGYLLIGHSESLHNISRAFKPEHYSGSIVYCKQS